MARWERPTLNSRSRSVDILGRRVCLEIDKEEGWVLSEEAGGRMAEIGLLPFAHVALEVARSVLPAYRSRFGKRQVNQPQLLK
jgi:hypothetical protein